MSKSFVKHYLDNKTGETLRRTISPNWSSTPQHLKLVNVPDKALRILEVGCGVGRLLVEIASENPDRFLVGVDASGAMIREGQSYVMGRNFSLL